MALTQAHLEALMEAWATGVLTVRTGDNSVTYRSREELAAQIAATAAALGVANPLKASTAVTRVRTMRFVTGKGL